MKKDTKQYEVPVNITKREIEALDEVISMYLNDERKHCEEYVFEETGEEGNVDEEEGSHVYYELKILNELLNRINGKYREQITEPFKSHKENNI